MATGGSTETFTYDGHGRRTRATTTSGTIVHFYTQAGQLLFPENPATPSTLIKSRQYHIYLGDRRVAQQESDGRSYIHTDHIGSLLARTDTAGSLLEGAPIWEAWGAPVSGYSSVGGLRFAGHYTDRTTGLSYMQQRYYDPYAGRFLAVDPVAASPGSFNRYWYANNNPYKYIDPDGQAPQDSWYGFNDKNFRDWVHAEKQIEQRGGARNYSKDEIKAFYDEWKNLDSPRGKGGKSGRGGNQRGFVLPAWLLKLNIIYYLSTYSSELNAGEREVLEDYKEGIPAGDSNSGSRGAEAMTIKAQSGNSGGSVSGISYNATTGEAKIRTDAETGSHIKRSETVCVDQSKCGGR